MKYTKNTLVAITLLLTMFMAGWYLSNAQAVPHVDSRQSLVLTTMGGMTFGGTVTTYLDGDTFHGDHGYAQYFIPQNAHNYPIVLWHGIGQSGACWETTPDGREGYMQILPRHNWATYIIDQPRRGRAGRTLATDMPKPIGMQIKESEAWKAFRIGSWNPPAKRAFFPNVAFSSDEESVERFLRWQTPDTGAEPRTSEHRKFMGDAVGDLFRKIGPGILITHSNSGQYGWRTALREPELVKAVVAYEPAAYPFPAGERPEELVCGNAMVKEFQQPQMVPAEDFMKLTKMPILIIFGANIVAEPTSDFTPEVWRHSALRAKQFVDAVNRHGGDARIVFLSDIGITNNTHFPFADLNNEKVAEHLEKFLREKGLAGSDNPHNGPKFIKNRGQNNI